MQSFTQMPADETLDLAVTRLNNNLNTLVSNNSGTSAPYNPVAGELFYNTSTNKLYRYSGTAWVDTTDVTATTSGSGNAVTDVSASGGALTVTKGSTFLTSHQDISGKQDVISDLATIRSGASAGATALQNVSVSTSGTGNAVTGITASGGVLSVSKAPANVIQASGTVASEYRVYTTVCSVTLPIATSNTWLVVLAGGESLGVDEIMSVASSSTFFGSNSYACRTTMYGGGGACLVSVITITQDTTIPLRMFGYYNGTYNHHGQIRAYPL